MTRTVARATIALLAGMALSLPIRAAAQAPSPGDGWQVDIAPLYLWAAEMDGTMTVGQRTVPVFMDFGTTLESLAATFTFSGEVRKGRWGAFADIGFVRLATDAEFEVGGEAPVTVDGRLELDNRVIEGGGSLRVARDLAVIGGVRTYTFSPNVSLRGAGQTLGEIDRSKTNVDGFAGLTWRPRLSPKWTFLSRGDLGGGESDVTWSGLLAFEYRMKPFAGLLFGYRALGIHADDTRAGGPVTGTTRDTRFDLTQYGPIVAGTFHWGR